MRQTYQMLVEGVLMGRLGDPTSGLKRIRHATGKLNVGGGLAATQTPASIVWSLLRDASHHIDRPTAKRMAHLVGLLLELEQSASPHSDSLADILVPSASEADVALTSALQIGSIESMAIDPSAIRDALQKTSTVTEALAIAIAVESKARSLEFGESSSRKKWLDLANQALTRSAELQDVSNDDFENNFPVLARLRGDLTDRLAEKPKYYVGRAQFAKSQFRFREAEHRLRDGIAHLPENPTLWQELADTLLTELELNNLRKPADAKPEMLSV